MRPRRPVPPAPAVSVRVVRAHYGANDRVSDVTFAVQRAVDAQGHRVDKLVRADSATLGGDPAPGVVKTLVVTYSVGGPEFTVITAEGQVRGRGSNTPAERQCPGIFATKSHTAAPLTRQECVIRGGYQPGYPQPVQPAPSYGHHGHGHHGHGHQGHGGLDPSRLVQIRIVDAAHGAPANGILTCHKTVSAHPGVPLGDARGGDSNYVHVNMNDGGSTRWRLQPAGPNTYKVSAAMAIRMSARVVSRACVCVGGGSWRLRTPAYRLDTFPLTIVRLTPSAAHPRGPAALRASGFPLVPR